MRPIKDFDKVQARGSFRRLPAGGYVIKIQSAKDCKTKGESENSYLLIVFDIAEGPEANRYLNETAENDFRHAFKCSYKPSVVDIFKQFTDSLEASNPGYKWDWKEQALGGMLLGVVFGYEEYNANDGNVKERLRVDEYKPIDAIRKGDFKVPDLKKLPESQKTAAPIPGFTPLGDENVPF